MKDESYRFDSSFVLRASAFTACPRAWAGRAAGWWSPWNVRSGSCNPRTYSSIPGAVRCSTSCFSPRKVSSGKEFRSRMFLEPNR